MKRNQANYERYFIDEWVSYGKDQSYRRRAGRLDLGVFDCPGMQVLDLSSSVCYQRDYF